MRGPPLLTQTSMSRYPNRSRRERDLLSSSLVNSGANSGRITSASTARPNRPRSHRLANPSEAAGVPCPGPEEAEPNT